MKFGAEKISNQNLGDMFNHGFHVDRDKSHSHATNLRPESHSKLPWSTCFESITTGFSEETKCIDLLNLTPETDVEVVSLDVTSY